MTQHHVAEAGHWETRCSTLHCGTTVSSDRWSGNWREQFDEQKEHNAKLAREGWRCFASNTRRYYCPEHGPRFPLGRNTREVEIR